MEQFRPLVITDLSAEDLENIRIIGKMKVYAVVSITGGPSTDHTSEFNTAVDDEGETYPKWNTRIDLKLHEPSFQKNLLNLNINFHCSRTLGDKHVGGVTVPVKRLFETISGNSTTPQPVRYPVVRSSGGEQGSVKFSFAFGQLSPQPGQQQPLPQRPNPPQPARTPPSQPTQRHVLPALIETAQQKVLSASGNSPYPPGNTREPVNNQLVNDIIGTPRPQYGVTNDPTVRSQSNIVGDQQPQYPANNPSPRGQPNIVGDQQPQYPANNPSPRSQPNIVGDQQPLYPANDPSPRSQLNMVGDQQPLYPANDPSQRSQLNMVGDQQQLYPANDPSSGSVNALGDLVPSQQLPAVSSDQSVYDYTSGANNKNNFDQYNEEVLVDEAYPAY